MSNNSFIGTTSRTQITQDGPLPRPLSILNFTPIQLDFVAGTKLIYAQPIQSHSIHKHKQSPKVTAMWSTCAFTLRLFSRDHIV